MFTLLVVQTHTASPGAIFGTHASTVMNAVPELPTAAHCLRVLMKTTIILVNAFLATLATDTALKVVQVSLELSNSVNKIDVNIARRH
jgi:hypothetical protein